jgi:excisionase family DNA binding protein
MRDLIPPRTIRQAAEELNLSVHTIRLWVHARKIGHIRLGKSIRIPADEIQRLLERGTVPAAPAPVGDPQSRSLRQMRAGMVAEVP